jgi:hypothetical protein
MSHVTGSVQPQSPVFALGPAAAAGTTAYTFNPPTSPQPGGTKLLILHFTGVALPGGSRLEVDLGYGTDVFTAADGPSFWTRPVNVFALPAGVTMRLVATGAGAGASIDRYGRGERHAGAQDPTALSNCDPFLGSATYTEPKYDPFWYCAEPPDWDNIRCVAAGDIRRDVAASVGMIIHEDAGHLSTCSVTLVDADLVVTAGHCLTDLVADAASGSIVFGYQTNCDGSRPAGYAPIVAKCLEVVEHRNDFGGDYALIRIKVPAGGLGIPSRQLRHDVPAADEPVFGVHHPNGSVMKLSPPRGAGLSKVKGSSSTSVRVPIGFDVSGGSSGSALFDQAGRVVGVLSAGNPCGRGGATPTELSYFPVATMLTQVATPPPPAVQRDVVLVVDRSGSMSLLGESGRPKIAEARDAASLFVRLVRASTGNKVGLVSFSTTSTSDVALSLVTPASKTQLVGPAPYITGAVGALAPGGTTSIGAGLDRARSMLHSPADAQPDAILLLTDGLQNTPPMIADVEGGLAGIAIHAVGYGSPGSLDGQLLTALASGHNGRYVRADSSLRLEKFFAQAFGAIFEAGLLTDPEFDLPEDQPTGDPMPFDVCGEEAVTVVLGWDDETVDLGLEVTTPGGTVLSAATPGVVADGGRTWRFMRIPLPALGERDGQWSARPYRPGGGEFPPGGPAVRYFTSVVASGGPQLLQDQQPVRYYTGDPVNPLVRLAYATGGSPENASVQVTVTGPDVSAGTFMSQQGLAAPLTVDGDVIPGRQATVLAAESAGSPPVGTVERLTTPLGQEPGDLRGAFEGGGRFGKELVDLLTVDGDYTVHAVATYGEDCVARREVLFSWHVEVGVDPEASDIVVTASGTSGGDTTGTITITPKDKYGNHVGPGLGGALGISGAGGTTVTGPVVDLGNGSYDLPASWPAGGTPGVVVGQPGRPPVVVAPPATSPWGTWPGCLPWLLLALCLLVIVVLLLLL